MSVQDSYEALLAASLQPRTGFLGMPVYQDPNQAAALMQKIQQLDYLKQYPVNRQGAVGAGQQLAGTLNGLISRYRGAAQASPDQGLFANLRQALAGQDQQQQNSMFPAIPPQQDPSQGQSSAPPSADPSQGQTPTPPGMAPGAPSTSPAGMQAPQGAPQGAPGAPGVPGPGMPGAASGIGQPPNNPAQNYMRMIYAKTLQDSGGDEQAARVAALTFGAQNGVYGAEQALRTARQDEVAQAQKTAETQKAIVEAKGKGDIKEIPLPNGQVHTMMINTTTGAVMKDLGVGSPKAATEVTINQDKPFLSNFAKTLDSYKVTADNATRGLDQINDMKNKLNDPKAPVITGTGAEARLAFGNMLASAGFGSKDTKDAVANTQAFLAETKAIALASKPNGMSRITNFDLAYLAQMAAGDIGLTKQSIQKVLDIRQKAMEGNIDLYNKQVETLNHAKGLDELPKSLYPRIEKPVYSNPNSKFQRISSVPIPSAAQ